jgi:hypothetical protein
VTCDIYNQDWCDNVYKQIVDPDEQSKRNNVSDVVTRQKDLIVSSHQERLQRRGDFSAPGFYTMLQLRY